MTEKTTNEKIADIIGFFLSLDAEDQKVVIKAITTKKKEKKND
tara:strand:+ start:559 stop:687 length:129 start_codon:yes stop_codon:yes gene_type:complete